MIPRIPLVCQRAGSKQPEGFLQPPDHEQRGTQEGRVRRPSRCRHRRKGCIGSYCESQVQYRQGFTDRARVADGPGYFVDARHEGRHPHRCSPFRAKSGVLWKALVMRCLVTGLECPLFSRKKRFAMSQTHSKNTTTSRRPSWLCRISGNDYDSLIGENAIGLQRRGSVCAFCQNAAT